MAFIETIKKVFGELFLSYNYKVTGEKAGPRGDFVRFSSEKLAFEFVYDNYEKTRSFYITSNDEMLCENFILEEFLNVVRLPIFNNEQNSDALNEEWSKQTLDYFIKSKDLLLAANDDFLLKLGEFDYQKAVEYNKSLGIHIPKKE